MALSYIHNSIFLVLWLDAFHTNPMRSKRLIRSADSKLCLNSLFWRFVHTNRQRCSTESHGTLQFPLICLYLTSSRKRSSHCLPCISHSNPIDSSIWMRDVVIVDFLPRFKHWYWYRCLLTQLERLVSSPLGFQIDTLQCPFLAWYARSLKK